MSRLVVPKLSRRLLLTGSSALAVSLAGGIAKPSISRAGSRPLISHGVQSGDVSGDGGVVWARADRPARMLVDVATTDSFKDIRHSLFMDALPESDFTAKALIEGLPAEVVLVDVATTATACEKRLPKRGP